MNTLRVLTYHRVLPADVVDGDPRLVSATRDAFAEQMAYVSQRFTPVKLSDLFETFQRGRSLPDRAVLVTFDDAYTDFQQYAWPVMRQLGIRPVLFVPTAYPGAPEKDFWWDRLHVALAHSNAEFLECDLGHFTLRTPGERSRAINAIRAKCNSLKHSEATALVDEISRLAGHTARIHRTMDWASLRQVADEGVDIGSHSHTHAILSRIPLQDALLEVKTSRECLREHLGWSDPVVCYPAGGVTPELTDALGRQGIIVGFTTRDGHNRVGRVDPRLLHRTNITRKTNGPIFRLRMTGLGSRLDAWRHARSAAA